jgi:hypothetical protein
MTREEAEKLAAKTPGAAVAQVRCDRVVEGKDLLYLDVPQGDWEMVAPLPGLAMSAGDWCVVRPLLREGG